VILEASVLMGKHIFEGAQSQSQTECRKETPADDDEPLDEPVDVLRPPAIDYFGGS